MRPRLTRRWPFNVGGVEIKEAGFGNLAGGCRGLRSRARAGRFTWADTNAPDEGLAKLAEFTKACG